MAHRGRAFHFNREHLSPAPNDIIRVFALRIGAGSGECASAQQHRTNPQLALVLVRPLVGLSQDTEDGFLEPFPYPPASTVPSEAPS